MFAEAVPHRARRNRRAPHMTSVIPMFKKLPNPAVGFRHEMSISGGKRHYGCAEVLHASHRRNSKPPRERCRAPIKRPCARRCRTTCAGPRHKRHCPKWQVQAAIDSWQNWRQSARSGHQYAIMRPGAMIGRSAAALFTAGTERCSPALPVSRSPAIGKSCPPRNAMMPRRPLRKFDGGEENTFIGYSARALI